MSLQILDTKQGRYALRQMLNTIAEAPSPRSMFANKSRALTDKTMMKDIHLRNAGKLLTEDKKNGKYDKKRQKKAGESAMKEAKRKRKKTRHPEKPI